MSPGAAPRWPWPPLIKASAACHGGAAALALLPGGWPWALGALAANHALLTALGLWPRSRGLGPNITRLPGTEPRIAITIDDGPDPDVTPRVLDLLDTHGATASFFCIAERARKHPVLLREIVQRGHSVQNHSRHHRHHFSLLGPKALQAEIGGAQALLADLTGIRPTCFRAPAGLRNPLLDPVLHRLNLHLVSWTRRGFDTREADPDRVLQRLTSAGGTHGIDAGDILLLHDGHARRGTGGQPVLLSVLPRLLERCRAAGLATVRLCDALPPRR